LLRFTQIFGVYLFDALQWGVNGFTLRLSGFFTRPKPPWLLTQLSVTVNIFADNDHAASESESELGFRAGSDTGLCALFA
jgi:hypothetical protein